jgi:hypothetical protein
MAIQMPEELFLNLLSRMHQAEQREPRFADGLSWFVQNSTIREALEVRAYLGKQEAANVEECFRLLGEQPRTITPIRFEEVLAEDTRRELDAIQSPVRGTASGAASPDRSGRQKSSATASSPTRGAAGAFGWLAASSTSCKPGSACRSTRRIVAFRSIRPCRRGYRT